MKTRRTVITLLCGLIVAVSLAVPVQAALIDRGMGLIYDDVLDITWLQDASQGGFGYWDQAEMWADTLVFGGFDDWRLPSMSVMGSVPTGSAGSVVNYSTVTEMACRDNELG